MKQLLLITLLLLPFSAYASDAEYKLVIKDHRFQPNEITIPAGKKIRLMIENNDATPEEFDSHALNREKVLAGNSKATVNIGPLKPGRYTFVGEFHEDTAQGVVIVK